MKTRAVLSALGRDRVGIAGDLAATLAQRNIEIEDSRGTALAGRFALVAQICGDESVISLLRHDLAVVGVQLGYDLQLEPIAGGVVQPSTKTSEYSIECFSPEQAGFNALAGIFNRHDVNIEDLATEASIASCTNEMAFVLKARVAVPASCSVEGLRKELRSLEQERDLNIVIKPSPARTRKTTTDPTPVL